MTALVAGRATLALILREMSTSYGRTPGGYLWAVAEPVAAVALLTVVFALAFDHPPIGRDFALFYASGYLPFAYYSDLVQKIGVALRFSRPLMAYPKVSWWDALMARFLLNSLTNLVVIGLVLGAIVALSRTPLRPDAGALAAGLGLAAALGAGFGILNAFLFEAFPIWERAWAILNRPLFILSGVLFLPDAVPRPYDDWIWLNPLVHVIAQMRAGLYSGYAPDALSPGYVLGIAALSLLMGLLLLRRHARQLLDRI
ncbi:ABC transporter permease [Roseovarius sp. CH_XMU1461]|uniref:ABC transporter permease n=1 Tax=Roseovarius sp. CH_XMU1461 TaxID=3107777 RepID=UPI003009070E